MATVPDSLAGALQVIAAGRLDEAETLCRRIAASAPKLADPLLFLGVIASRRGRPDEAIRFFRRALKLDPDYVDAHINLGNALQARGEIPAAIDSYRRAIVLEPKLPEAHFNLGNALALTGDAAAVEAYGQALRLKPGHVEALNNLGAVLRRQGKLAAAAEHFRRALALKPDHVGALVNLGNTLTELGDVAAGIASLRRALALEPDNVAAHSDLIFGLNFDASLGTAELQAERRRWAKRHAARFYPKSPLLPADRDPERRLRIGYVSAHFRAYAASYAFGGVLTRHDKGEVEVFCYSDTAQADDLTPLFRRAADHWRDVRGMSDDGLADLIRRDRIDILVDLVGHMVGHRLLVFARRPAPIQITAWGEPTGTGLATMDYLFADPVLVPAAERNLLAERVIDLPAALGFWLPDNLPEPGPLPALANGFVTFGSFNRRAKITGVTLAAWAGIMAALPKSRLVLKNKAFGDIEQQDGLNAALKHVGIPADRVTVLGQTARAEHFAAYRAIDIALDPFPHGGGMTTLDALAMGIPVVTYPGRTISSRLAASCLAAIGLDEFVATDAAAYAAIALAAAKDLPRLAALRADLRQRLAGSVQGDPARYAGAVEAAYRAAWRRSVAGASGPN